MMKSEQHIKCLRDNSVRQDKYFYIIADEWCKDRFLITRTIYIYCEDKPLKLIWSVIEEQVWKMWQILHCEMPENESRGDGLIYI